MMHNRKLTEKIAGLAVLIAIVAVLQFVICGAIKIGPVNFTLSLVPVVIGAILFGPSGGAITGAALGIIIAIMAITGMDPGAAIMFQDNPFVTVAVCIVKTTVAGWLSGVVSGALIKRGKNHAAVALASILCPFCNTSIFCLAVLTFFRSFAMKYGGQGGKYDNVFAAVLFGLVGMNFVVELAINVALAPAVVHVIKVIKKTPSHFSDE